MKSKIYKFAFLLFCLISLKSFAQVNLTLPTITGLPNTEVNAPVTVNNLSGLNITSFQFQVNFDSSVIEIMEIVSAGTLTSGSTPTKNSVNSNLYLRVAWASATPLSGSGVLFYIKIKFKSSGSTPLTYVATDGSFVSRFGTTQQNITVTPTNGSATVSTTNYPPVFDTITDKTVTAGQTLTFTVNATDPEGQNLTYTSANLPQGANFNQGTKTFTWTPTESQVGNHTVIFYASDGTNTASLSVKIIVLSSNTPPVFDPIGDKEVDEGQFLSFQVSASDAQGDPITYTASNLPQGASFNAVNRIFEWVPMYNQAGIYYVTFTASDGKSSSNLIVKITVKNVNRAPVFTVSMSDREVTVHNVPVEFKFQYSAQDPDNDPLSYSIDVGPVGATINSTGLLSWTPTTNQANMQFTLTVRVSDGNLFATTSCKLTTTSVVSVDKEEFIPSKYFLAQNYPNPFNPSTIIEYSIPEEAFVTLKIFTMLGEEIRTLVNENKTPGKYKISFAANDLPSGIYFYKLMANNISLVKKMIYLR